MDIPETVARCQCPSPNCLRWIAVPHDTQGIVPGLVLIGDTCPFFHAEEGDHKVHPYGEKASLWRLGRSERAKEWMVEVRRTIVETNQRLLPFSEGPIIA
jgi:hypothetical protein